MRAQRQKYPQKVHRTKIHCAQSKLLMGALVLECLRQREKAHVDGWKKLSELKHGGTAVKPQITGTDLKGAFRDFQVTRQGGRCCYCRRWLVRSAHAMQIDHILPKDRYPRFALHFWNLAVACADCNGIKSNDTWEPVCSNQRGYAAPSAFVESFHPRFHKYDEHVRFVRVESNGMAIVLYRGITQQGRHLCHALLGKVAAQEALLSSSQVLAAPLNTLAAFNDSNDSEGLEALKEFQRTLQKAATRILNGPRRPA